MREVCSSLQKLKLVNDIERKAYLSSISKISLTKGASKEQNEKREKDYKESANHFLNRLKSHKLGKIMQEEDLNKLEIDKLISKLSEQEARLNEPDEEVHLLKNMR
jgi:hypothetical protein